MTTEPAFCFTTGDASLSYAEVQRHTHRVAHALRRAGIAPGDKVAVLSGNDPIAFACVFGISRAAAVWRPFNPRNEAEGAVTPTGIGAARGLEGPLSSGRGGGSPRPERFVS